MQIIVCPGMHSPALTHRFLAALNPLLSEALVFPSERLPAYSPSHLLNFLTDHLGEPKTADAALFISFSAGVVGAIGAARTWQKQGGVIKALVALDGWGVPLYGNFPIHRLSHDAFTHWSSAWLGTGEDGFYAEPSIAHLDLWQMPQRVNGYQIAPGKSLNSPGQTALIATTAADFLRSLIIRYGA
jgi:hypothetical protein